MAKADERYGQGKIFAFNGDVLDGSDVILGQGENERLVQVCLPSLAAIPEHSFIPVSNRK